MSCATPANARALLQNHRAEIDLVITNNPLTFIDTPEIPLLYLSANPLPEAIQSFARALPLAKPFHPRELFECIRQLLA